MTKLTGALAALVLAMTVVGLPTSVSAAKPGCYPDERSVSKAEYARLTVGMLRSDFRILAGPAGKPIILAATPDGKMSVGVLYKAGCDGSLVLVYEKVPGEGLRYEYTSSADWN
jgi:hypothetical protein